VRLTSNQRMSLAADMLREAGWIVHHHYHAPNRTVIVAVLPGDEPQSMCVGSRRLFHTRGDLSACCITCLVGKPDELVRAELERMSRAAIARAEGGAT